MVFRRTQASCVNEWIIHEQMQHFVEEYLCKNWPSSAPTNSVGESLNHYHFEKYMHITSLSNKFVKLSKVLWVDYPFSQSIEWIL